jgi:hypothetical protein
MARVMQSVEAFDGLTYSNTGSHIFRNLDDGHMGLILIDMVKMAHLWIGNPYFGKCTHILPSHLMEDIALRLASTACIYEMHPLPTLDVAFYTLDARLFDDDIMCYGLMEMMGFVFHVDTTL